jgi:hypothetical protein
MQEIPSNLYHKIRSLSNEVHVELRKKGVVVPVKNTDGSISLGQYKITKTDVGYTIIDHYAEPVVENLNLAQSAILVANGLALGRYKDEKVIDADRRYGYALFEEELHKKVATKKRVTLDYADLMHTKAAIAKVKKDQYKRDLLNRFEKLIQLV